MLFIPFRRDPRPSAPKSLGWLGLVLGGLFLISALPGLAQERARKMADKEVDKILEEKADAIPGAPDGAFIKPDPRARFADPTDPDHPPQPQDDPTSHAIMEKVNGILGMGRRKEDHAGPLRSDLWIDTLPRDKKGRVILSPENAMFLALLHSRSYQAEKEDLYLSALDVSEQRYRFSPHLALTNRTDRNTLGPDRVGARPGSSVASRSNLDWTQQTATGADLVMGLANSILVDISGNSDTVVSSVVNFGVVQPLLRFSAREFVLEELTQSERDLLSNVRRMKQFQQGFAIDIAAGRSLAEGPVRGGGSGIVNAPQVAGSPNGGRAGGFLGLLQTRQQIRNQEASVAALRDSLAQLQAAFDAGRINNRLQVDQARQALYNSQSSLLTAYAANDSSVDSYKISLGLPPDLEVVIEEGLLDRFNLVDPSVSELQSRVASILDELRLPEVTATPEDLQTRLARVLALSGSINEQIVRSRQDITKLRARTPERRSQLTRLGARPELANVYMDANLFDPHVIDNIPERQETTINELQESIAGTLKNVQAMVDVPPPADQLDRGRGNAITVTTGLSSQLLELSLVQAATRLESITLEDVDIDFAPSLELARTHRLDWMNARAGLVDSWRQIAVDAEALKNGLNLIVSGDIPTVDNKSADFRSGSGRVQFGLELDTPLRRLLERNDYKESLINFQRARRGYMQYEDQVQQSLRNSLRIVRLSQLNFEVRRAAVRVAIAQVDLARLRLNEPPKPGAGGAQFGATTARDLVSALGDLLDAQNDFLNVWVNFEVLRMLLDYELGTMRLDQKGVWMDPGRITAGSLNARLEVNGAKDSAPPAVNLPVVEVAPPAAAEAQPGEEAPRRKRGIFAIFGKN